MTEKRYVITLEQKTAIFPNGRQIHSRIVEIKRCLPDGTVVSSKTYFSQKSRKKSFIRKKPEEAA